MTRLRILAPLAGWSAPLREIPDAAFAQAMLGEGAAIDPVSRELRAPCDGEVISIAASRHALALRAASGAEVLVHVGIDTVGLGGQGFEVLVRKGDRVRAGDLLLTFDLDSVARAAPSLMTPIIVTNGERFRVIATPLGREVKAGDLLFEVEPIESAPESAAASNAAPVVSEAVVVEHAHGIHARPAALIARLAKTVADRPERLAFVEVASPADPHKAGGGGTGRGFRVSLGTIPDYAYQGKGMKLTGVRPDAPGSRAGLQANDVVVKLGTHEVANVHDYMFALGDLEPGRETTIEVERDGKRMTLKIVPAPGR